jgi:hypothetical protein
MGCRTARSVGHKPASSPVAPAVALWDSDVIPNGLSLREEQRSQPGCIAGRMQSDFHHGTFVSMRAAIATRPALISASGVVAVLLLCASVAYATPAGPRRPGAQQACFEQTTRSHKMPRHPKSFGGPLARPSTRLMAGLIDLTTLVKRGLRANLADDDEAIQNDAPAARIDIDDRRVPALLPIGVLPGSFDRPLSTHTFSPRSPRGPPTSA